MTMYGLGVGAGGDADSVFPADQKHTAQRALNDKVRQPLPAQECSSPDSRDSLDSSPKERNSETADTSPISSCHSFGTIPESFKNTVNPLPPPPVAPPRAVLSVKEADVAWLNTKSKHVHTPFQHYDAISIVHMVSPTTFMAVSHLGNERPRIGRFLAIQQAIVKCMKKRKELRVPVLKPGAFALVLYKGEYARAVLLSGSQVGPGYLRFACLDIHAVIELPASDVFTLPGDLQPQVVPCNLFLAHIHGVGPIKKHALKKYLDRFNCQETPITTVCVIRSAANTKFLEIDFVLDDQWISETLLSMKDAPPLIGTSKFMAGHLASTALPSPTVVRNIIEAMIEAGGYDFPPNASILDSAGVTYVSPQLFPGYDVVLRKICPDSTLLQKKAIDEQKITKEVRPEADGRAPSSEVATDPWNDQEKVQEKLNFLKGELNKVRAGTDVEIDAVLSDLIMTAVKVSFHADSLWTHELSALAEELRKNAVSPIPI